MYTENNDYYDNHGNDENNYDVLNKKKSVMMLMLLVIACVVIMLFVKLFISNDSVTEKPKELILNNTQIVLSIGDTYQLKASMETNDTIIVNWISSDEKLLNVSESGLVTALDMGKADVIAVYYDSNNDVYTVTCEAEVIYDTNQENAGIIIDTEKPTLDYEFMEGEPDVWNQDGVIIKVVANDNIGIKSVKYSLNCVHTCQYLAVPNNGQIIISDDGITILMIVVTDTNNNTISKILTVKIDRNI